MTDADDVILHNIDHVVSHLINSSLELNGAKPRASSFHETAINASSAATLLNKESAVLANKAFDSSMKRRPVPREHCLLVDYRAGNAKDTERSSSTGKLLRTVEARVEKILQCSNFAMSDSSYLLISNTLTLLDIR